MTTASEVEGTHTISTLDTEETINTPSSAKSRTIAVNINNLAGTETVTLYVYEKVLTGDSALLLWEATFPSWHSSDVVKSPPVDAPYGASFRIRQKNGSVRSFKWRITSLD